MTSTKKKGPIFFSFFQCAENSRENSTNVKWAESVINQITPLFLELLNAIVHTITANLGEDESLSENFPGIFSGSSPLLLVTLIKGIQNPFCPPVIRQKILGIFKSLFQITNTTSEMGDYIRNFTDILLADVSQYLTTALTTCVRHSHVTDLLADLTTDKPPVNQQKIFSIHAALEASWTLRTLLCNTGFDEGIFVENPTAVAEFLAGSLAKVPAQWDVENSQKLFLPFLSALFVLGSPVQWFSKESLVKIHQDSGGEELATILQWLPTDDGGQALVKLMHEHTEKKNHKRRSGDEKSKGLFYAKVNPLSRLERVSPIQHEKIYWIFRLRPEILANLLQVIRLATSATGAHNPALVLASTLAIHILSQVLTDEFVVKKLLQDPKIVANLVHLSLSRPLPQMEMSLKSEISLEMSWWMGVEMQPLHTLERLWAESMDALWVKKKKFC
jgi:hypothetical protein